MSLGHSRLAVHRSPSVNYQSPSTAQLEVYLTASVRYLRSTEPSSFPHFCYKSMIRKIANSQHGHRNRVRLDVLSRIVVVKGYLVAVVVLVADPFGQRVAPVLEEEVLGVLLPLAVTEAALGLNGRDHVLRP